LSELAIPPQALGKSCESLPLILNNIEARLRLPGSRGARSVRRLATGLIKQRYYAKQKAATQKARITRVQSHKAPQLGGLGGWPDLTYV